MSVNMTVKCNALFFDFSQARKGKYLKPAAVGQDRAVPVHKLVEAAHLAHHIVAGAQMQVVRVGKLDLTAEVS